MREESQNASESRFKGETEVGTSITPTFCIHPQGRKHLPSMQKHSSSLSSEANTLFCLLRVRG